MRARWRLLRLLEGAARTAVAGAGLLAMLWLLVRWLGPSSGVLIAATAASLVLLGGIVVWGLRPVRHDPSDRHVARFIEERAPGLDDCLVTAVDLLADNRSGPTSPLAQPLMIDAAKRARSVDVDLVFPSPLLRRAGLRAAVAVGTFLIAGFFAATPARQAVDAASLLFFPERLQLLIEPGDARIVAGTRFSIEARLLGNTAPVDLQVEIVEGDKSRRVDMVRRQDHFHFVLDRVTSPFRYRVVAARAASPTYTVAVTHLPRVNRIDVDYTYPASLGLKPRKEADSGDIYAPSGTEVRVSVHTDVAAARGQMTLSGGMSRPLTAVEPTVLATTFTLSGDDSYRIGLFTPDGAFGQDDTEYFIRVLEDRPPEVHITKPAGDRPVTRLEEIEIEVQADDDYGVDRLELVYAVRGAAEKVIPLETPRHATSVVARQMLYLEDLDVEPGDFVSYYARARDVTRGSKANDARSDIFFLEVKPYEQEFSLAMSQSMAGSGYSGALEELVDRQRQVVVATWKLNRRTESARAPRSDKDLRTIGQTEADLKLHVEQAASTFRESTMRDPRRRGPVGGSVQVRPEDDAMSAAAEAMGSAAVLLEALNGKEALSPEMQALNHLLRAQAEIKRRQLSANQSAGASGNNNRNYDISTLFDRELQRQQQTNYESPKAAERSAQSASDTLDRIRELAKRQDELLRRQQTLARAQAPEEERKRELERLTRDQNELRRRAEELAREMSASPSAADDQPRPANSRGQSGQQGRPTKGGSDGNRQSRLRDVSEAMRQAAGELQRGASERAGVNAQRALDELHELEQQMQRSPGADRQRTGDAQLEARQLAEAQRQLTSELAKLPQGDAAKDGLRRLSGNQAQLADRMQRLQRSLDQEAGRTGSADENRSALHNAARDLAGLSDLMQKSADEMQSGTRDRKSSLAAQEKIARLLERAADRLNAATGAKDDSRALSEQLARTQDLHERLERTERALQNAGNQNGRQAGSSSQKTPGESGRLGEGRQGAGGIDTTQLREDSLRQLQEAKQLLDEIRQQASGLSRNGAGFTLEGQGMILSAPGSEGFKQDFAKWELLKQQALLALEQAESTLAKTLQARVTKDRLSAGAEDKAPSEYQKQVDSYFKALAAGKSR